ncbi:unnamed protein product [Alternaria alternata]
MTSSMRFSTSIVYGTHAYWCKTSNPWFPQAWKRVWVNPQAFRKRAWVNSPKLFKWSILYLADALDLGGELSMHFFHAYTIIGLETHRTSPIILYYPKDCKVPVTGLNTFSIPVVEGYVE